MDILRSKYNEICYRGNDYQWYYNLDDTRRVVNQIDRVYELMITECFFKDKELINCIDSVRELKELVYYLIDAKTGYSLHPFPTHGVIRLSKKVDKLLGTSPANETFVDFKYICNVRDRSQLFETIWENLMDPNVRINGIYGYGGVGKTTTMRKIHDQLAASSIFDKIFWVTLSKDLSLRKLQSDIALQMNMDLPMHVEYRAAQIHEGLKKIKKFLIIFDGMCQLISLEKVGIPRPKRKNGCNIVMITRSLDICKYMKSDIVVKVETLSEKDAWKLFVSKAGNVVQIPEIQPYAKQVVQHCRGIPIGLLSVGHAMRDEVSVEVWRRTSEYIHVPEVCAMEDYVLHLLYLPYNRLNNDKVQNCFLYCAFFPASYLFKPAELVRYWMAETFVHKTGNIVAEIDEGFQILSKLQDANMLQVSIEGGEVFLKMHDLLRDFAIGIMEKLPGYSVKAGLGLGVQPSHKEWARAEKISLMRNSIQTLSVVPYNNLQISTLLMSDNPISGINSSFFSEMLALKFLDLSYSQIIELPTSLSELSLLRVLFLHYCTHLEKIPSLEKLKKLEVLCLCGTGITELPRGMEGLVNLRSLDLSETVNLEGIRVGQLSSLSRLEELRLQGSGLCKVSSHMVANLLMEMRSLKHLSILTLSVVGYGDHLETIMCLQEQNLKIFSVKVYGSTEDYIEDV